MNRKNITLLFLIFAVLVAFMVTSCEGNVQVSTHTNKSELKLDNTAVYYDQNYVTYTLEGCEYILVGIGNNRWGSHKGNCKNPIHNQINK